MTGPNVQVPVSMIESHVAWLDDSGFFATAKRWRALLSQPTPTAEPDGDAFGRFVDSFNGDEAGEIEFMSALDGRVGYAMVGGNDLRAVFEHAVRAISQPTPTAEPPRIEDLAPGTRFWARLRTSSVEEQFTKRTRSVMSEDGDRWPPRALDPSTIRDVTPAKET